MHQTRANRILSTLKAQGAEQMLITDPMSIFYLTDVYVQPFERFFGLLLRADGHHVLFLNRLFFVPQETGTEKVWYSDTDPVMDLVANYLDSAKPLAVDKEMKARHLLPLMEKHAAAGFLNGSLAVDKTRGIKDAGEQEKMITASRINDMAMARFKALVKEGITELEVAGQLLDIYRELGADGYSFSPLVAFGANAADPHHEPDSTAVKPGDCVLFDVGCIKDGYCSDMTRTFFFREASEHCRNIYTIVRRANEAAEALIHPGVRLCELDAAARDLITAEGYGPQFNHRLGHFIGQDVHEQGEASPVSQIIAEEGMIFSVEPGVYIEGEFGVRIEDLVMVTKDGCRRLNNYPKELTIIE